MSVSAFLQKFPGPACSFQDTVTEETPPARVWSFPQKDKTLPALGCQEGYNNTISCNKEEGQDRRDNSIVHECLEITIAFIVNDTSDGLSIQSRQQTSQLRPLGTCL